MIGATSPTVPLTRGERYAVRVSIRVGIAKARCIEGDVSGNTTTDAPAREITPGTCMVLGFHDEAKGFAYLVTVNTQTPVRVPAQYLTPWT